MTRPRVRPSWTIRRYGLDVDQATAVVLSGVIGASAAIGAQVIAAHFTSRAARERLEWERSGRFADDKRRLFAAFLAAHTTFRDDCLINYTVRPLQDEADGLIAAWFNHMDKAAPLQQEIELVAPGLAVACEEVMLQAVEAFTETSTGSTDRGYEAYRDAVRNCRREMSAHLGVEIHNR